MTTRLFSNSLGAAVHDLQVRVAGISVRASPETLVTILRKSSPLSDALAQDVYDGAEKIVKQLFPDSLPKPWSVRDHLSWVHWSDAKDEEGLGFVLDVSGQYFLLLPHDPLELGLKIFFTNETPFFLKERPLLHPLLAHTDHVMREPVFVPSVRVMSSRFSKEENDRRRIQQPGGLLGFHLLDGGRFYLHPGADCVTDAFDSILLGADLVLGALDGLPPQGRETLYVASGLSRIDPCDFPSRCDPRWGKMEVSVRRQRPLKTAGKSPIGIVSLISGGEVGVYEHPQWGIQAATSMGTNGEYQDDSALIAAYWVHDATLNRKIRVQVAAVADGMGGHLFGNGASSAVVQAVEAVLVSASRENRIPDIREIIMAIEEAFEVQFPKWPERALFEKEMRASAVARRGLDPKDDASFRDLLKTKSPGTTAAVALLIDRHLYVAHVGDSPIWVSSPEREIILRTDIDAGERSIVTKSVGVSLEEWNLYYAELEPDMDVHLVTDGPAANLISNFKNSFSDFLRRREKILQPNAVSFRFIEEIMKRTPREQWAQTLLAFSEGRGSFYLPLPIRTDDNGTVAILSRLEGGYDLTRPPFSTKGFSKMFSVKR